MRKRIGCMFSVAVSLVWWRTFSLIYLVDPKLMLNLTWPMGEERRIILRELFTTGCIPHLTTININSWSSIDRLLIIKWILHCVKENALIIDTRVRLSKRVTHSQSIVNLSFTIRGSIGGGIMKSITTTIEHANKIKDTRLEHQKMRCICGDMICNDLQPS